MCVELPITFLCSLLPLLFPSFFILQAFSLCNFSFETKTMATVRFSGLFRGASFPPTTYVLMFSSSALTRCLTFGLATHRAIMLCHRGSLVCHCPHRCQEKTIWKLGNPIKKIGPWLFSDSYEYIVMKMITDTNKKRIQKFYSSGRTSALVMCPEWNGSALKPFHSDALKAFSK